MNNAIIMISPEGLPEVWDKSAEADLVARGYIPESERKEWLKASADAAYTAWLVDPATIPERFERLRNERDARLSATDWMLMSDTALDAERQGKVRAYRQALRDLPQMDGAPWDGGGSETPWPSLDE